MKSPLLAARSRILTSASKVTRIIVLFAYFFFFCYSFSCERNLCGEHKARRRTAFQLAAFPSALSVRRLIVGRFAIATMQPPTSAEDYRLQLRRFAEATYYCYLPLRVNYLINFIFI